MKSGKAVQSVKRMKIGLHPLAEKREKIILESVKSLITLNKLESILIWKLIGSYFKRINLII